MWRVACVACGVWRVWRVHAVCAVCAAWRVARGLWSAAWCGDGGVGQEWGKSGKPLRPDIAALRQPPSLGGQTECPDQRQRKDKQARIYEYNECIHDARLLFPYIGPSDYRLLVTVADVVILWGGAFGLGLA